MSSVSKLYEKDLAATGTDRRLSRFRAAPAAFGFLHDRTVGSYRQYTHLLVPRSLPVQPSGKDAKRYQIRQFLDMVEEFGLSIEE